MTASAALACGARGASTRIVIVRCDKDGCDEQTTYTNREEYWAAGLAGWRRDRAEQSPDAKHRCPAHAHELGELS